jgi:hypothetical protein
MALINFLRRIGALEAERGKTPRPQASTTYALDSFDPETMMSTWRRAEGPPTLSALPPRSRPARLQVEGLIPENVIW